MGIITKILSKSLGSFINAGDAVSLKKISIFSPSNSLATSIKYLELKVISKSCSNLTETLSFPSPLWVLLTDRSSLSFDNLIFTPSFYL